MGKYDNLKEEIIALCNEGKSLQKALIPKGKKREIEATDFMFFIDHYDAWYTRALLIVTRFIPQRKDDFILLYKNDKRKVLNRDTYTISDALRATEENFVYGVDNALPCMYQQNTILASVLKVFDSQISNIQTILQADIFDSEIDSAIHLKDKGFVRAAGAICGVIIEKHLSEVCSRHSVEIKKKNPSIADYNDGLKEVAYDILEWRKVQHYADIRNYCDHKKEREPTKEEVEELIAGTKHIIKTIG